MGWIVTLTGDEIDLRELAKVCNTPELTIEKDGSAYILKSTRFDSLADQEICKKANELLIPINAGIIISLGASNPIKIGQIMKPQPDGSRLVLLSCTMSSKARAFACLSVIKEDGTQEIHNAAESVIPLFNLAKTDPQVAKMCQYINQNFDSWFTLYNILEILQEDKFPLSNSNSKNKEIIKRFKATANSYKILGMESRHADPKISYTGKPMSFSEAQDFIKMLVREWIESKQQEI